MTYYRQIISLLLFMVASASVGFATENEKGREILIISSYGSDYQWSNDIIDRIGVRMNEQYSNVDINVEHLSSERFNDADRWTERVDLLLNSYTPDMLDAIVFISDEAWMAYLQADNGRFKDIPLFLCAVKPHTSTIEAITDTATMVSLNSFAPTEELAKKHNATGVIREMNIPKYFELMNNTIANLDQYVVITDNRFYGIYMRLLTEDYLKRVYPKYAVRFLDAGSISTDSLMSILPHITPTSAVLMTSWLTGQSGFQYSKKHTYKNISANLKTPIFITNDIGINSNYFIGGYFATSDFWGEKVSDMIIKLFEGTPAKEIGMEYYKDEDCQINWNVMKRFKLTPEHFPRSTEYINRPASLLKNYKNELISAGAIFLIIFLIMIYMLRHNIALKKAKEDAQKAAEKANEINRHLSITKESLKEAVIKAENADRMKSAFISSIEYEIRSPLNTIVGFSGLISTLDDKEEIGEAANHIAENSERLLKLINSILDLSQIESGNIEISSELFEINGLLSDIANSYKQKAGENVEIRCSVLSKPQSIRTDAHRLTQALRCLMNNAVKFTQHGFIVLGYTLEENNQIEFYVKDTGIGVRSEEQDMIFDRFYKSDPYSTGTGLGLPTVKKLVELLDGEVGFTSNLNIGSRFWIRIKTGI